MTKILATVSAILIAGTLMALRNIAIALEDLDRAICLVFDDDED